MGMNQFLVLKYPGKVITDIKKVEVVKIIEAENEEFAKDEFLIWLKGNDLVQSTDHYFLAGTDLRAQIQDAAFLLKTRRSLQSVRGRPVCE